MTLLSALRYRWTLYRIVAAAMVLGVILLSKSFIMIPSWSPTAADSEFPSFRIDEQEPQELYDCHHYKSDDKKCPSYFSWIHEDMSTWEATGITQQAMEQAKEKADYHVVIIGGKLYTESYHKCFQTRDNYTLWGLFMLLERYPGMVPDLEMYGTCGDAPQIHREDFSVGNNWPPPPLFVYCTTRTPSFYDIVLPDWSFWGWPEVNIRPWAQEKEHIFEGSSNKWSERQPVAFWRGNKWMSQVRRDVLMCNGSDFNVLAYHQDWGAEAARGFSASDLSQQCFMRYKLYAEGGTWSVGLKYATACGSTLLQIDPLFEEFFSRSWLPYVHYWPIARGSNICNSIKYAVEWGNAHPTEVENVAKCGRSFIENHLTMDHVYQYMLHLLRNYAKLLKFKPVKPKGVREVTRDSTLLWHELTLPSDNQSRQEEDICFLPPRDEASIARILARQASGFQRAACPHFAHTSTF